VLEGNLDDFTLPDILRLLAFTSKSGRLAIHREGTAGRIDLADGRVREASADADHLSIARRLLGAGLVSVGDLEPVLQDRDELPTDLELARDLVEAGTLESGTLAEVLREQTVDAVFDLLRWTEGNFRFDGGAPDTSDGQVLDLAVPVDEVLTDATSRLEAWPAVAERTGDGDAVVTISRPAGERAQVSLPPDGWSLLSLVDGRRTVAELARLSGQGEFRTRRTLVALLDEGVVSVGDTDGPGHVERLLAEHDRLAALETELGAPAAPRPASSGGSDQQGSSGPDRPQPAVSPAVSPASSTASSPADAAASAATAEDPAPTPTPTVPAPAPAAPSASAPIAPRASASGSSRPGPVTVRTEDIPPVTAEPTPSLGDAEAAEAAARGKARGGRLRTDPSVDADLVRRLIDGVESL
jgi:hypothetical protein